MEKLENVGHKVGLTLTVSNTDVNFNRFSGCLEVDRSTDQKKEGSSVGGLSEVVSDGFPVGATQIFVWFSSNGACAVSGLRSVSM